MKKDIIKFRHYHRIISRKNYLLIPYRLTIKEPVKNAFKEVDSSYEHILIAGGDGTVDLVVNAMKELDIKFQLNFAYRNCK